MGETVIINNVLEQINKVSSEEKFLKLSSMKYDDKLLKHFFEIKRKLKF